MHAHLIPFTTDSDPGPPHATDASCRLVADPAGWLLALTERATDAPYEVEAVHSLPEGSGAFAAVVEFDGPRDAAQLAPFSHGAENAASASR